MQTLTIQQLYGRCPVPDNLAEHMLLTAAMGQIICQHWTGQASAIKPPLIITTLLLHDVANLIKFDLTAGLELTARTLPLDIQQHHQRNWWRKKQTQMKARYNSSAAQANLTILQQLGLNSCAELLNNHTFDQLKQLLLQDNKWQKKIIHYCDLRFTPQGLSSVKTRVLDLKNRYQAQDNTWKNKTIFEQRQQAALKLEQQLNAQTSNELPAIKPSTIKQQAIQLASYPIKVKL